MAAARFLRPPDALRTRGFTIVVVTFLLALAVTLQLKGALIPASNRVERNQSLVRSAQALDQDNANLRTQLRAIDAQIRALNEQQARRSAEAHDALLAVNDEKERAGRTPVTGPGISIDLANGNDPHIPGDAKRDWQVKYIDIQDVVNLLWSAGAEAVSVNRQRVVASSSFYVAGTDVLLNGVHLTAPYRIEAIGDSSHFNQALSDQENLSELKNRSELYQLKFTWQGQRSLDLPAYDGPLAARYSVAGQ